MTPAEEKPVRVRLAPSPTGHLHVGTARTALFNWLFARQHGGSFILRIEDTDKERSVQEYEREILDGLAWLGLSWDEGPVYTATSHKLPATSYKGNYGPYRQSERTARYRHYLQALLDEGKAYYCYCTKEALEAERELMLADGRPPKYGGHCRNLSLPPSGAIPETIRFKTPEAEIEFKDMIRGKITFDGNLLGDMVIAKNLDTPLYNFAVVVDDVDMRITHVIRGEDHLPNTPKQILFQRALGFAEPAYAHLPLILGKNREKMSKRHAETSLLEYRTRGYLPEAVINFLALLGWHPQGDEEIFSLDALTKEFSLKRVQKGGAVFDEEKLEWMNAAHIKRLPVEEVAARLKDFLPHAEASYDRQFLVKVVALERDRLKTLGNFFELAGFFFELPEYDSGLLTWQDTGPLKTKEILEKAARIIESLPPSEFGKESLARVLEGLVQEEGRGGVLWPLRVAVSGRAASPDPLDIISILEKDETLRRVRTAIQKIESTIVL